jgi:hypothetical protein
MIHHIPEGNSMRLGLNYRKAPGGFVIWWAWYNFHRHEATAYRFRLRLHMKPRIIWSVSKWDVIDSYLLNRGLALVNREWLEDTYASERDKRRRERAAVQFGP